MPRIPTKSLIRLSQRVGTAVRSGIDARRTWEMEERNATGSLQTAVTAIRKHVAAGGTVAEAMHAQQGYFPPMYVQMVAVGEQTGKLDEVLLRLAEHYEHQASMQRMFWMGIAWPLLELIFAIGIIGLLILILGMLGSDARVFGIPVGPTGAVLWFLGCGLVAGGIALAAFSLVRGWFGPQPVFFAMRIPVLGKCLESFALSRLTWALGLALDSGMDAMRSAELSIKAAQNPYFESSLPTVLASVRANHQFHEAYSSSGVYPADFIQQLEAAEIAGVTNEALFRLAKEYEDRARMAMNILTGLATVGVMLLVGGLIIFAIFWLFIKLYMGPINEALEMTKPGNF